MADADPKNRTNHYGSQPISSVRGLETELKAKQDANPKLESIAEATLRVDAPKGQIAVHHGEDRVEFRKIGLGPSDLVTRELAERLIGDHSGGGNAAASLAVRGGGIADGDKGDIVVSNSAATWTIDPAVLSTFGRSLASASTAALARTTLGLGTAAVENVSRFPVTVDTRTNLAAYTATSVAYLYEAGREGAFKLYTTSAYNAETGRNLTSDIAADPNQGIFVATATGAWVRRFFGDIHAKWFGMVVDNATDDSPAIQAAVALANALATSNVTGYGTASPTIMLPGGVAYTATKISLGGALGAPTSSVRLIGEHSGYGRSATVLRFPANTTGIEIFAPSCAVEQMAILGGWVFGATAEGEYHGIKFHYQCTLRNLFIQKWQGDLIHGVVSSGSGGDTEGIANELYLERISGESGRCGLYLSGSDVNAGNIIAMNFNSCRRASVYDISFLSNVHIGHQSSGTGINEVGSGVPYVACYNNGHLFQCIQGQATGASTNSPPATATSNTYWKYWKDLAAQTYAPQWTNGMSVRDGGAYVITGGTVNNPYSEQGEVPPQYGLSALVINGVGTPKDSSTNYIVANSATGAVEVGNFAVNGNFSLNSTGATFGVANAVSTWVSNGGLDWRHFSGGGGSYYGSWQMNAFTATVAHYSEVDLSIGASIFSLVAIAKVTSAGLDITTGKVLSNNGTTILNGSGVLQAAGFPALTGDATTSAGSLAVTLNPSVQTKITGYTEAAISGINIRLCDLAAGFTVVLPTAVGNKGLFTFKKMQAAGSIIIDGAGTETIDGALTATLANRYESISLVSDGANWSII